ncbi:hypothetical protein BO94DRAFT_625262 [Aspergillus sclerotioniger CBS 115572]|uniref:Class I glutamine amidotransferase-like protein n=1 Tax=Aspergillus sclerotioniger CBS 115572 TaxID=1450535 RepID=A0A317WBS6_9EURO|nr:hypothetical protein BO94DRAFT_625262 [Aspergillus sclerotioniger CBS 115572]PWY83659.1 hypothetical protein BO94DRAFT_625262 [Aspergillus sclerotioniger CBS 115572]
MKTTKNIHIAILDTDVPVPNVYYARGLYSTQFRTLLSAAASRINDQTCCAGQADEEIRVHTTAFDALGGQLPSLSSLSTSPTSTSNDGNEEDVNPLAIPISAILITGSVASVYDPTLKWVSPVVEFIRTVYERYPHVKIFGSCFGHQIVAQALLSASSCSTDGSGSVRVECCPVGMEVGLERVQLTKGFADAFPCLNGKKELRLQMVHGDWVSASEEKEEVLPSPWMNVGSTAQCPIQGLYCPGRVLSYQGHFEFDSFVNRETCVEFGRRLGWKEDMIARYVLAIGEADGDEDDSKLAAEVVVRFLAGEDEVHSVPGLDQTPASSLRVREWLGGLMGLIGQLVSRSTKS